MTDPITHANTVAEIDGLKARLAKVERERDEARAESARLAAIVERLKSHEAVARKIIDVGRLMRRDQGRRGYFIDDAELSYHRLEKTWKMIRDDKEQTNEQ